MFLVKSLTVLGFLNLANDFSASGSPYLSAASGLVHTKKWHIVVADDENHLGVFPIPHQAGKLRRLAPGDLPKDAKMRKEAKKDFEALAQLPDLEKPSSANHATVTLLALASGSKASRQTGYLISFNQETGDLSRAPQAIDLSPLYASIMKKYDIKKLNIEGALQHGQSFLLFQRGNNKTSSAVIELDYQAFRQEMLGLEKFSDKSLRGYWPLNLGNLESIPLGFTDATSLPSGKILFSAAAEDTDAPQEDGRFSGSILGILDPTTKKIEWQSAAITRDKVEGIAAEATGENAITVTFVTDADKPETPSTISQILLVPQTPGPQR